MPGQSFETDPIELADARPRHHDTFGRQERPLQHLVAAITAQAAAGGNHAVTRHVRAIAAAHDVADGTCRARPAGHRGDVAVGRHASWRDATHDGEYLPEKGDRCLFHLSAARSGRPSACGSVIPQIAASVGVISAGVAG